MSTTLMPRPELVEPRQKECPVNSTRYKVAGAICLVVGGAATLLQYIVTPLSNGNMTGAETVAAVTAHHTAMTVTLVLDSPNLLALPAVLVIGGLARARTSVLASIATVLLFCSTLLVVPQLFGLDGLAFLVNSQPDQAAMAHLIDSWQNSTWFAVGLFPYLLGEIVGSIMMAVALFRARKVPRWAAVTTAIWPLLGVLGQGGGGRGIAIAGYALLFITWTACALSLVRTRQSEPAPAVRALVEV